MAEASNSSQHTSVFRSNEASEALLRREEELEEQENGVLHSAAYNVPIYGFALADMPDDAWSCLAVLIMFWLFVSMVLIFGFYGSVTWRLGPNSSRIIQANRVFVQSIKADQFSKANTGPVLYGFRSKPSLNVEVYWSESHEASVAPDFHQEWMFFLNKGSILSVSYSVKSSPHSPVSVVIAAGRESLMDWIDNPSRPNTTLSWNIVYGSGRIKLEIPKSASYYIAVGNLNPEKIQVYLNFTFEASQYNTTMANYRCYLDEQSCSVKILLLRRTTAVIASPEKQDEGDDYWDVKISYGPRWATYFLGSGAFTIVLVLTFKLCTTLRSPTQVRTRFRNRMVGSNQTPILQKDGDVSSWGSSYGSLHDDEDYKEQFIAEGSARNVDGDGLDSKCVCVVCLDSRRDCFFLPCGHCATCFICGTRIAEEAGTCPICRRKLKKVRKIFAV